MREGAVEAPEKSLCGRCDIQQDSLFFPPLILFSFTYSVMQMKITAIMYFIETEI